jgi:AmmeMemoRadiSam system protein A
MIPEPLTEDERKTLLKIARKALVEGVTHHTLIDLDLQALPERLQEPGTSFVTLTIHGELRGCIGALEAHQPLAQDVAEHAVAAALEDFRFPPVDCDELPEIEIEISRLTPSNKLDYEIPADLCERLRPGVDGVILRYAGRRATFLPQVWEKIPDPEQFLSYLCQKMGAHPDLWRHTRLEVFTYQVEEFKE